MTPFRRGMGRGTDQVATKPKRPEEMLASPFVMAEHLASGAVSRKMGEEEHGDHEYCYRSGMRAAEADSKRREIERSYGPVVDEHLLYVPEGYRNQLRNKYMALLGNTRIRDYPQIERILARLPAECYAVRQTAKQMGLA